MDNCWVANVGTVDYFGPKYCAQFLHFKFLLVFSAPIKSADALILYCISIEFPNDLVHHVLSDSFLLDKVALLQSGKVPPNCAKIILRHRYKSKCIWGKLLQNKAGATAGSTIWSGHFYFYHIGAKIMISWPFVLDRYTFLVKSQCF